MARSKWEPDARQARTLDRLAALHDAKTKADEDFRAAVVRASAEEDIIPTAIAERLGMERKSVYRILGHRYT